METIGRASDGGFLVKMNTKEYDALSRLAMTIEGQGLDNISAESPRLGPDLSTVLGVIHAYATTKGLHNSLMDSILEMQSVLDKSED